MSGNSVHMKHTVLDAHGVSQRIEGKQTHVIRKWKMQQQMLMSG